MIRLLIEKQIANAGFSMLQGDENDDTELVKSLAKQRRRAMAAARKGHHKNSTSRNSYKDKGGKSSNNSKIQKQLASW